MELEKKWPRYNYFLDNVKCHNLCNANAIYVIEYAVFFLPL